MKRLENLAAVQQKEGPVTAPPPVTVARRLEFTRDLQDVPGQILDSIQRADYKTKGAPFGPFNVIAGTTNDFVPIFFGTSGDQPIVFFGFNGARNDGYLPLGDVALVQQSGVWSPISSLLFSKNPADPDGSDSLAHPRRFDWVLDSTGSGNEALLSYWWPVAPEGYTALGLCFNQSNSIQPDPNKYWCVKTALLRMAAAVPFWSDAGQHWKYHNGSLMTPALDASSIAPDGDVLYIVPPTFLSVEGMRPAYVIAAKKSFLPITVSPANPPTFDPNTGSGSVTPVGLLNVAVLPFTAVTDAGYINKPGESPFYYLANEPYWLCNGSRSTPGGGQFETSVTVGVSTSSSESFSNTTSFTVGVNAGISAGDKGGPNFGISVSYTNDMNVTTEQTQQNDSSTTDTITVQLPSQPVTQFWQRVQKLVMYRTDGTIVSVADYGTNDLRFIPNGQVISIR
ncbi:Vps62-related protein [Corallococcus sp. CA041A]|uniref:Vps62-related protein n=1 Tax=Corallococcus sp. CA041A TaxID=2316727 RepID=UPI001315681C|nr:Vps62-related protein [Corallococcus sp. CA041A]